MVPSNYNFKLRPIVTDHLIVEKLRSSSKIICSLDRSGYILTGFIESRDYVAVLGVDYELYICIANRAEMYNSA